MNAPSDYEIELRLLEKRDGGYACFLKLLTIAHGRFAYRKNAVAASIHPATAAMIVALAEPYLKENAQILDPFCGVGTMLIERDIRVPAQGKNTELISLARRSGEPGRMHHMRGRKSILSTVIILILHMHIYLTRSSPICLSGEESQRKRRTLFTADFFEKSAGLLKADGILVLYSMSRGFIRKQLRIRSAYRLLAEQCIREKDQFYLFVIQYKG